MFCSLQLHHLNHIFALLPVPSVSPSRHLSPPPPLFSCPVLAARRRDIPAVFRNDSGDSSVLNSLRERRSGTDWGGGGRSPMAASPTRGITSAVVIVCLQSRSFGVCRVPGAPPPSPTLCSTLTPILSAQTPTFSSTGTRSTRQSSCLMPKQMTNHVRIWPFLYYS